MLQSTAAVPVQPFAGHAPGAQTLAFLAAPHRLLIDGQWVDGTQTITTCDPATGLPLASVSAGGAAEIDAAVRAARAAFEGGWGRSSAAERSRLLLRLAELMRRDAQLLGELDILDNGMPAWLASHTALGGAELFEYYAGWPLRIEGVTTPPPNMGGAEALTYTLREPVGVIGQIIPWNVPLSMACMKLAPALAAGCTVVLKPAEETPLSALKLGQLIVEAGFPAGGV
ncbi:MAG TPA: aldehyde dehydrogenase family protein, partial [Novosphingobium sp.]|nr:aldehyde dehydrogenase family protein [Novosphingobium sp.]